MGEYSQSSHLYVEEWQETYEKSKSQLTNDALGELILPPSRAPWYRSYYGLVLTKSKFGPKILGAWNYPFDLTIGPLTGAIAAGNTAVIKFRGSFLLGLDRQFDLIDIKVIFDRGLA